MSSIQMDTIERAKADLEAFIEDNFDYLDQLLQKAPKSFSVRSSSLSQDVAWTIGFKRCLAELKRIASIVKKEKEL